MAIFAEALSHTQMPPPSDAVATLPLTCEASSMVMSRFWPLYPMPPPLWEALLLLTVAPETSEMSQMRVQVKMPPPLPLIASLPSMWLLSTEICCHAVPVI